MSPSLVFLSHANAGATRAAIVRAQQVATAGYYFGYWFSHRRA